METGLASFSPAALAELRAEATTNKAWPFEEARKLIARYPQGFPEGGVLFETGYGPSGLPHIGTFGEVVRTTMVRPASSHFPTTWTACARSPRGSPTRTCSAPISTSR
jgi:hypothetical protein